MNRIRLIWVVSLIVMLVCPAPGQEPSARRLSAAIDAAIAEKIARAKVAAAPAADDAEFLRRVYLDLAGKIPAVSQVRSFLADADPHKRARLVDELLGSSRYVVNFTTMWRNALIPESLSDQRLRVVVPGFEAWLRKSLQDDLPYDEFVRRIIDTPLDAAGTPQVYVAGSGPTAAGFYAAKEGKAESLASAASRVFLGRRIGCAQCHDHPFDEWKQEQFWQFAAFFSGVDPTQREQARLLKAGTIRPTESEDVVAARFLDGGVPEFRSRPAARRAVADWIVNRRNPYFAEMAVNRMWGHFFGRGLVDPIDDFSIDNSPSHPELLARLSSAFVASDFDLKFLIRAIVGSQAYQRTSRRTDPGQDTPELYARMAVKGLTEEQIFDTLAEATGYFESYRADQPFVLQQGTPRAEFLELFRNDSDSRVEQQTTILQALAMMNGEFMAEHTHLESSQTLAAVAAAPFMDDREKVETLFLATLSRFPTDTERKRFGEYMKRSDDARASLCDIFWALLNCSEFLLNH